MNDATKIELLKIAADLVKATLSRDGVQSPANPSGKDHKIHILFAECCYVALTQFKALPSSMQTAPPAASGQTVVK